MDRWGRRHPAASRQAQAPNLPLRELGQAARIDISMMSSGHCGAPPALRPFYLERQQGVWQAGDRGGITPKVNSVAIAPRCAPRSRAERMLQHKIAGKPGLEGQRQARGGQIGTHR